MLRSFGSDTVSHARFEHLAFNVVHTYIILFSVYYAAHFWEAALCIKPCPFKLCSLVSKCQRHTAPSYLADMCIPVSAMSGRTHLRSTIHCDLVVPRTCLARCGPRSFAVSGPLTWNSLPPDLRDMSIRCQFLQPT